MALAVLYVFLGGRSMEILLNVLYGIIAITAIGFGCNMINTHFDRETDKSKAVLIESRMNGGDKIVSTLCLLHKVILIIGSISLQIILILVVVDKAKTIINFIRDFIM